MAAKDGAKLGAIFKNGELVAQARFIPASMTAATAIAAIGPAVAMIALQMQLGEISGLVRSNIQLTTQTLKAIRNEQWAELEGLAESVDEAVKETRELDAVTDSVWEPIAPSGPNIRKQLKLYRKNVAGHVQELGKLDGRARRQYLESNAEAIVFDTYALQLTQDPRGVPGCPGRPRQDTKHQRRERSAALRPDRPEHSRRDRRVAPKSDR